MNGTAFFPFDRPGLKPGRLVFSLVLSLLLHALAIFWLGMPRADGSSAATSSRALQVTFATASLVDSPKNADARPLEMAAVPKPPEASRPAEIPALPLPALRYFHVNELTKPPRIIVPPDLDNLRILRIPSARIELRIFIGAEGKVDDVVVIETDLPEAWARYAADAFRRARFEPGWIGETPVRSEVRIVAGVDAATDR